MDDELKKLLEENLVLNKENNFIIKKLYGAYKFSQITNIIKWIIIIGFAIGAFYFIQPYFDQLFSVYGVSYSGIESMLKK